MFIPSTASNLSMVGTWMEQRKTKRKRLQLSQTSEAGSICTSKFNVNWHFKRPLILQQLLNFESVSSSCLFPNGTAVPKSGTDGNFSLPELILNQQIPDPCCAPRVMQQKKHLTKTWNEIWELIQNPARQTRREETGSCERVCVGVCVHVCVCMAGKGGGVTVLSVLEEEWQVTPWTTIPSVVSDAQVGSNF